jgi:hypothetical protein
MECPLDQALQGAPTILTKIRPKDLGRPTPCASWDARALVNHFDGTARWWAAAPFGPAREAPGGAGTGRSAHRFPRPRGVSRAR